MNVKQLIEALSKMPQESEVIAFYDSAPRLLIHAVFKSKENGVILMNENDVDWYKDEYEEK